MYDGQTDGWTRQWAKDPTVNLFSYVFHILFKKKAFSHCMRNFSHSMQNYLQRKTASPCYKRIYASMLWTLERNYGCQYDYEYAPFNHSIRTVTNLFPIFSKPPSVAWKRVRARQKRTRLCAIDSHAVNVSPTERPFDTSVFSNSHLTQGSHSLTHGCS